MGISPYLSPIGSLFNSSGKSSRSGDTPKGYDRFSTLDPQQKQLFQQLLGSLSGGNYNVEQNPLYQSGTNYLQELLSGSPEAFEKFEAPYKRQFNEQTVPGLAERFSGLGSGSQSSSAFQQALGQAGAGLSENLAQLRSGLQMQSLPQAFGAAQQPFQNLLQLLGLETQGLAQKPKPWWQEFLTAIGGGVGEAFGKAGTAKLGPYVGL